jgi:transposase-like protein
MLETKCKKPWSMSDEQISQMRQLYESGVPSSKIAKQMGVAKSTTARWCRDLIDKRVAAGIARPGVRVDKRGLSAEDVITLRKRARALGESKPKAWAREFSTTPASISSAIYGDTFRSVNDIEPPLAKSELKRTYAKPHTTEEERFARFKELVTQVRFDLDHKKKDWTIAEMADVMREFSGGTVLPSHISMMLAARAPDVLMRLPMHREIPAEEFHTKNCIYCGESFKTPYTRMHCCTDIDCVSRLDEKPMRVSGTTARRKAAPTKPKKPPVQPQGCDKKDSKGNPMWKAQCVVCEEEFYAYAPGREVCNAKYCRDVISEGEDHGGDWVGGP